MPKRAWAVLMLTACVLAPCVPAAQPGSARAYLTGTTVHSNLGTRRSADGGALRGGSRVYNSTDQTVGLGAGESESSHSVERRHEANAAVRLVSKDGDVIWSTTQESMGGKFRGASADVADKITKRLTEDYEQAKKLPH